MWAVLLFCVAANAASTASPYDNWCSEGLLCTDDSQCKQDNGQNGACCLGKCRQLKLSRGEVCGSSLPNSNCPSCAANLNCADSGNGQLRCEQQAVSNGCPCNLTSSKNCISAQPCLPSGLCGSNNVAPNGRCEVSSQCYSNSVCNGTHCLPIPDGQGCSQPDVLSNLCRPGSICDDSAHCSVIGQYNDGCNEDYECAQPDLWCSNKNCANRTALGAACTGSSCVVGALCNNATCVSPRSVSSGAACSEDDACVSGVCNSGKCVATHFVAAGGACANDMDCPFGASCQNQICTISGLGASCDPTLGGGDMDKQCQSSKDLYCACSRVCSPVDTAILPTGSSTSDCQAAKDQVSKFKIGDLKKVDTSSLSAAQRTAIATDQCCRNCNKDARVSQIGVMVDCSTKTITQATSDCGLFAIDALALSNCPAHTASDAAVLSPVFVMLIALSLLMEN